MTPTVVNVEFMDSGGARIPFLPPGLVRIEGLWARQDGADSSVLTLVLRVAPPPLSVTEAGIVQEPEGRIMGVDHDYSPGGPQNTPLRSTGALIPCRACGATISSSLCPECGANQRERP